MNYISVYIYIMNFMEIQSQYYKTNFLDYSTIFLLHFIHFHNKLVDYQRQIRHLVQF